MIPTHFLCHSGWVDLCHHPKCGPPGGAFLLRYLVSFEFCLTYFYILIRIPPLSFSFSFSLFRSLFLTLSLFSPLFLSLFLSFPPLSLCLSLFLSLPSTRLASLASFYFSITICFSMPLLPLLILYFAPLPLSIWLSPLALFPSLAPLALSLPYPLSLTLP